jgi:hypothetical protein
MAVNTLAQSLGTAKPPVASLLSGDISRRGATSQKELPGMLERSYEAEEASQRAKIGAEQGQIQREAEALEGSAQELRQETERVRGLEQPYQEFQAPQYTAADYAKGAATRALTAVILGGVAKTSAMTQLKAIKAMQDAERDGRTQDFESARLTFDEAEKKRLDFNQRLKRDLDDFEKLLQTDTKAALVKAKLIGAETQDAMVKALIDTKRYGDAIKLARDQIGQADKLAMQREQQAARLEEAKVKAERQKGSTLSASAQKELRGLKNLQSEVELLEQTFKPEYAGYISDVLGNLTAMGQERIKDDPAMALWWSRYQNVANPERHLLYGATLTKSEQDSWRRGAIGPGNDPRFVGEWFRTKKQMLNSKIAGYEDGSQVEEKSQTPGSAAPAAAPVGPRPRSFATEAELEAAASRGEVRDNDEVIVGGVKGRYTK